MQKTDGTAYIGGFCVQKQENAEAEKRGDYLTIQACIKDEAMGMSFFMHDFPMYSWTLKQKCVDTGPAFDGAVKKEVLTEYAALVHYWAKKNYLNVPD